MADADLRNIGKDERINENRIAPKEKSLQYIFNKDAVRIVCKKIKRLENDNAVDTTKLVGNFFISFRLVQPFAFVNTVFKLVHCVFW